MRCHALKVTVVIAGLGLLTAACGDRRGVGRCGWFDGRIAGGGRGGRRRGGRHDRCGDGAGALDSGYVTVHASLQGLSCAAVGVMYIATAGPVTIGPAVARDCE
jgi:hypothetical protein